MIYLLYATQNIFYVDFNINHNLYPTKNIFRLLSFVSDFTLICHTKIAILCKGDSKEFLTFKNF